MALDGGADGLDAYRGLIAALPAARAGGSRSWNSGEGQAGRGGAAGAAAGLDPRRRVDLGGIARAADGPPEKTFGERGGGP